MEIELKINVPSDVFQALEDKAESEFRTPEQTVLMLIHNYVDPVNSPLDTTNKIVSAARAILGSKVFAGMKSNEFTAAHIRNRSRKFDEFTSPEMEQALIVLSTADVVTIVKQADPNISYRRQGGQNVYRLVGDDKLPVSGSAANEILSECEF